jgi:hypothetical protein
MEAMQQAEKEEEEEEEAKLKSQPQTQTQTQTQKGTHAKNKPGQSRPNHRHKHGKHKKRRVPPTANFSFDDPDAPEYMSFGDSDDADSTEGNVEEYFEQVCMYVVYACVIHMHSDDADSKRERSRSILSRCVCMPEYMSFGDSEDADSTEGNVE